MRLLVFFALLALSSASCPNDCNGHGRCNTHSACECYRNWQGSDCSLRTCYFSLAFVDTPQGDLNADGRVSKSNVYKVTLSSDTTEDTTTHGTTETLVLPAGTFLQIDNVATPCTTCTTEEAAWGKPSEISSWAVTAVESVVTTVDVSGVKKYSVTALVTTANGFAPDKGTLAGLPSKVYGAVKDSSLPSFGLLSVQNTDKTAIDDWKVGKDAIEAATQPFLYATQFTNEKTWEKYPANHAVAMATTGQKRFYDEAHFYAECSGKGTCNRDTGECDCFEGYSGSGCAQLSCPNACSGHGVCKRLCDQNPNYRAWDRAKTTTCVCDAGYTNVDCSDRLCPRGDDPISRDEKATVMSFGYFHDVSAGSFALEFKDEFGEYWTTSTLDMLTATDNQVEAALEALPNNVVQDVAVTTYTVAGTTTGTKRTIVDHVLGAQVTHSGKIWKVEFKSNTGDSVDLGVRYTMTAGAYTASATNGKFETLTKCAGETATDKNCVYDQSSANTSPTLAESGFADFIGLTLAPAATKTVAFRLDATAPAMFLDTYVTGTRENSLCSSRGLCDYSTGLCKCFNGFTDDDCSRQNALAMY